MIVRPSPRPQPHIPHRRSAFERQLSREPRGGCWHPPKRLLGGAFDYVNEVPIHEVNRAVCGHMSCIDGLTAVCQKPWISFHLPDQCLVLGTAAWSEK